MKRSLLFLLALISCSPILPIEAPFPAPPETTSVDGTAILRIIAIDVGQGDATLVIGPTGQSMLIDGGPPAIGAPKILETLRGEGIERLDRIVASHYDLDHIGGLPVVLAGLAVDAVLDRGDLTDQDLPLFFDYIDRAGPLRQQAAPGLEIPLGGGATATVVVVNGRYADGRSIHLNPDEENESSIGLLIRYGDFEYFTAGDLTGGGTTGGAETKDLESPAGEIIGAIDILHAGHHGSATSTNERFLELTQPDAAVISVGKENDYGHPTQTVLSRLEQAGAIIYRTDRDGTIEIVTDGEGWEMR